MIRVLAGILVLALATAPLALAHGGEEEALEKTPARALAQQALALLSQKNKAVEAHERIEAALKSKDREGVDLALLRRTQAAFERGDHPAATKLINDALTPKAEPRAEEGGEGGKAMGDHGDEGESVAPGPEIAPEALDHAPEFDPGRSAADDIAALIGLGLIAAASGLLVRRAAAQRRPPQPM